MCEACDLASLLAVAPLFHQALMCQAMLQTGTSGGAAFRIGFRSVLPSVSAIRLPEAARIEDSHAITTNLDQDAPEANTDHL